MKIAQLTKFGPPHEGLACVEIDDPDAPAQDEVLARVEAFPINPADLYQCEGVYAIRPELPATLGAEGVGVIAAVGSAVDSLHVGDRVIFRDRDNWVQRKTVMAKDVIKLPGVFQ
ncbi:MAG: alcohol dehydrogenase catalytic domain-containing protein, partial [Hyphomicrobiaceae bacterium]